MSDLAATNCGGGCSCNEGGCNSILWIIILLCCCGGNGGFCGGNNGCGGNNDCLWIILLLFCCDGCGGNNGCDFCYKIYKEKRLCLLWKRRFCMSAEFTDALCSDPVQHTHSLFPDSAAASSSRRFHIPLALSFFWHIPHLSHKHCFHQ